jgi:ferric-dicitrate binding protein FerR (iron transport regulator)
VWASLLVDGPISELERRTFEAHCRDCADCRVFADSVSAFTDAIRSMPLEEARAHRLRYAAPRRRPGPRRLQLLTGLTTAAAIAVAFAVGRATTSRSELVTIHAPSVEVVGMRDDATGLVRALRKYSAVRSAEQVAAVPRGRPGVQAG